jgi:hypothetical protein
MVSLFERISKQGLRAAQAWALAIIAVAALATATAGALAPSQALAGQYHVYSCRMPNGEVAPADGWSGAVAVGGRTDDYVGNTCGEGGALIAALGDQTTHIANTDRATWSFETPLGESLTSATLWRAGYVHGVTGDDSVYGLLLAGPTLTDVFTECIYPLCSGVGEPTEPMSSANLVLVPSANLGPHLYLSAYCVTGLAQGECPDGFDDPNGYAAVAYLYAADLVLEQTAGPTASNVSGELATASTVAGMSDIAFSASDPDSGVYEAVFNVDGKVAQTTIIDENGGSCRNVGQTTDGLPAFLYVQPCPASLSAKVELDTTQMSNGTHHLEVSVTDAAGNASTVLNRYITVDNPASPGTPGPPNGTNASAQATLTVGWKGSKRERLLSGFDNAHTIVGRLAGVDGMPIGGAQVDVLSTPDYVGAKTAAMPSVRTSADGSFMLRLPAGMSSRTLRFEYSDDVGSPPVVTRALTLSVRAGIALKITPRTASVGRSIYFSGRLRGGPVPSGGKLLVLEARSPGGAWLEFDVIRSDARGRFHASYRFKFSGPADYQFRVLSEAEADYPFATGASQVIGVYER